MKTQYQKEPTSVSEQIDLLESKGMDISDRANAYHILSIIGYYRFSGYAYPFRNESDNSSFVEGTSFDKVYGIYEFDRSLKALLFSYLARIEVAFSRPHLISGSGQSVGLIQMSRSCIILSALSATF